MTTHRPSSRPSFSDHARTATDRGPASDLAIGVDVGTSGVGVVALDRAGRVVATADHPVPLATPQPGWTEQDPSDWVAATQAGLASVAKQVGADRVVALGLSGQMHGMVATDANGRVLRPALLWNDQRTAAEAAEIEAAVGRHRLIARTGNPAITGFQLPKVLWLRRHEPQVFARTARVALPKDHVATVLTGDATAEPTDASGTGAYELRTGTWDTEVLAAVDLDPSLWPRLVRSHEVVGPLRAAVAEHVGLRAGLPVVAGAGDNAAASTALALGARHREVGSVSLGTSGVLFAALEEPTPEPEGRVHLFAHADGGFNLLGVTLSAAGSLRWYRDVFAPNASYDELMVAAGDSRPGANGVTFKPYLAGERSPHLRPDLRGSFHGLSLATSRADVVRAVIEGVAFSLRETYDVMSKIAAPSRWLATGGGARSDLWLTVIATLLGAPVGRPAGPDGFETSAGAAEGAAWLAWRALGHDPDRQPRAGAWLEPDERSAPALEDAYQRYLALGPRG